MKSVINPEITYAEDKYIDTIDSGVTREIFIIDNVKGHSIECLVGNILNQYKEKYGVVYFNAYLMKNNEVVERIGVIEHNVNDISELFDSNGVLNIEKLNVPLLHSRVTTEYLTEYAYNEDTNEDTNEDSSVNDTSVEDESKSKQKEEYKEIVKRLNELKQKKDTLVRGSKEDKEFKLEIQDLLKRFNELKTTL